MKGRGPLGETAGITTTTTTTTPADVGVVLLDKPPGMTPLAALEQLRRARPTQFPEGLKMSYAGRLDPLAHGLLVCLVGSHRQHDFRAPLSLQKEVELQSKVYEFQVLFGVATDTYDIMGLVQERRMRRRTGTGTPVGDDGERTLLIEEEEERLRDASSAEPAKRRKCDASNTITDREGGGSHLEEEGEAVHAIDEEMLRSILPLFTGKRSQVYPPFSSARVKGKPLFYWARQGPEKMAEIMPLVPKVEVEIQKMELLSSYSLSVAQLRREVWERIGRVEGDFRQKEILESWQNNFFSQQRCFQAVMNDHQTD